MFRVCLLSIGVRVTIWSLKNQVLAENSGRHAFGMDMEVAFIAKRHVDRQ